MDGYERAMEHQRQMARSASSFGVDYSAGVELHGTTDFTGYEHVADRAEITALIRDGEQVDVINVFHGNSPSDDVGTLTRDHLTGLGMGDEVVIAEVDGPVDRRAVDQHDRGPGSDQALRGRSTDAGRRTGDDGDLAV